MNLKTGLRRVTLILAIVAGVFSSMVSVESFVRAHDNIRFLEAMVKWEEGFYEGFRKGFNDGLKKGFNVLEEERRLEEIKNNLSEGLDQSKNNFWAKLSIMQAFAICVSTGIAGFCGVWLVYRLIEWLLLGFRSDRK